MADSFDPYLKWLGIPPEEQPPNHYRLLGIPELIDDLDVIESAADRQMAHVRSFQVGKHAADSQRLLNEISNARLCLLKPEKKRAYDEQLRTAATVEEPAMVAPTPQPLPRPTSLPPPSAEPPVRDAGNDVASTFEPTPAIYAQTPLRRKGTQTNALSYAVLALGIGAGIVLLAIVGWMFFQSSIPPESWTARQPGGTTKPADDQVVDEGDSDNVATDPFAYRDEPGSEEDDSPPKSGGETEVEPLESTSTNVSNGSSDTPDDVEDQQLERLSAERKEALERGDLAAALALTERYAALVDGDVLDMKLEVITSELESADAREQYRVVATHLLSMMEEAFTNERWAIVERHQDDLLRTARDSADSDLVRKATLFVLKVQQRRASDSTDDETSDPETMP